MKSSFLALLWSLVALAVTLIGAKKASVKITLAGQLMGLVGVLWAWTNIILSCGAGN